jgi:hypothetical protein
VTSTSGAADRDALRRVRRGLFFAVACSVLMTSSVGAQSGTLPQELRGVARQHGCDEVKDFYDRPGLLHPPFVFGIDPAEEHDSAAFWCQGAGSRTFTLVLMRADGRQTPLPWSNFPGGLSLTSPQDFDLSRFSLVQHPDSVGPRVMLRGVRAIRSYYDGLTELFVEYCGRWWVRMDD